jgi:hypothetical protein
MCCHLISILAVLWGLLRLVFRMAFGDPSEASIQSVSIELHTSNHYAVRMTGRAGVLQRISANENNVSR